MSFSNDFLVIIVVFALTFLMWLCLRETFGAQRRFTDRLVTFPLYVFLAIWSIGFGYGFWWSLIAGEEATRTGLSGLQQDAGDAGGRGRCAPRCGEGAARFRRHLVGKPDGARGNERRQLRHLVGRRARPALCRARKRARPDRVPAQQRAELRGWHPCRPISKSLQKSVAQLQGATVAERQQSFDAMASDIRTRARDIAARSNELGKSTATEMRAIAAAVSVAPGQSGFTCHDPTLAQRLTQAADQADQPATLKLREAVVQRRPRRRRQRHQAALGEHRYVSVEPVRLHLVGRQDDGGDDAHGPADHRPRHDRAAGHHRHRPWAAGAGDPQSAAGPEPAAVVAGDPADPRRHQHRDRARARRQHGVGAPPLHLSQGRVVPRDSQPLQLRSQERGGKRAGRSP